MGVLVVSGLILVVSPDRLYFRAWEYFNEVVANSSENSGEWHGREKGGGSRAYLFRYQDAWHTDVSVDDLGFRSVPFESDAYPILVVGDSQVYGVGLSDDETLPWKLAEVLDTPVYNGGHPNRTMDEMMALPALADGALVIEMMSSNSVLPTDFEDIRIDERQFDPVRSGERLIWKSVPVQRWYWPARFFRSAKAGGQDLRSWIKTRSTPQFIGIDDMYVAPITESNITGTVDTIVRRSDMLRASGYEYMFVAIPKKQLIYSDSVSEFSQSHLVLLTKMLRDRGVNTLDLSEAFLSFKDTAPLFFYTDSHWTSYATDISAELIGEYIVKLPKVRQP